MGYTLKAMQVALWCAREANDFEEALITVVSAGGDTDTNGAVAGAVLGARFGSRRDSASLEGTPRYPPRRPIVPMQEWADRCSKRPRSIEQHPRRTRS